VPHNYTLILALPNTYTNSHATPETRPIITFLTASRTIGLEEETGLPNLGSKAGSFSSYRLPGLTSNTSTYGIHLNRGRYYHVCVQDRMDEPEFTEGFCQVNSNAQDLFYTRSRHTASIRT
jgi:hypothetical protein